MDYGQIACNSCVHADAGLRGGFECGLDVTFRKFPWVFQGKFTPIAPKKGECPDFVTSLDELFEPSPEFVEKFKSFTQTLNELANGKGDRENNY